MGGHSVTECRWRCLDNLRGQEGRDFLIDYEDRIDPELASVVCRQPDRELIDIARRRAEGAEMLRRAGKQTRAGLIWRKDYSVPGAVGDPPVRIRAYRPLGADRMLPCLYWIHGGGHISGSLDLDDALCESVVEAVGCAVVSVDWRLSPENPFPAAAEDCYAGLRWVIGNGDVVGIDVRRVVIGGSSSGGGSAAGVALMARDRHELAIAGQLLIHPMLDDRPPESPERAIRYPKVWNSASNELGWRSYLGDAYGTDEVSEYAAPARAVDVSGLPQTFIGVGELDLFVDECIAYGQRLIAAGVSAEFHVYPGATHGFSTFAPAARVSRQFIRDRNAALRRFFGLDSVD